ncbi:MAG: acyl-ACP--UDP-N-acetylglucosamine O-acyltransferase [Candidatus Schekmanbacteria bacterium]|nr:MAG: acyl-ACP--UDP-N-acetylglucosamine O-acyltransferase [Candidatus Schekmanbacteria bacterium]
MIHKTAVIEEGAVIGDDVSIGPFSVIGKDVQIGDGTVISSNVRIEGWTKIGKECRIEAGAIIGGPPQDFKYKGQKSFVIIGDNVKIREYVTIHRSSKEGGATTVGSGSMIMAYSHIAHDCQIGNDVVITNYAGLSGHVQVEDKAIISGFVGIHQFCRIGKLALVRGFSGLSKDIAPFTIVWGITTVPYGLNVVGLRRSGIKGESLEELKKMYKIFFQSGLSTEDALVKINEEVEQTEEVKHFIDFVRSSKRGVCKREKTEGDIF